MCNDTVFGETYHSTCKLSTVNGTNYPVNGRVSKQSPSKYVSVFLKYWLFARND